MKKKLVLLLILACAALLFFGLGLHRFLRFEALKSGQATFALWYAERPLTVVGGYFLLYVLITALSLPGAAVMSLAGGALFGLGLGVPVVSFASTIGATLAFVVARFLLHDPVQRRFGERLAAFNRGMARDGNFYLFSLRLVPVFPFFIINLVMALTPIRLLPFYWVSQLGMLPATFVFVNAGTRLAEVNSPAGILSPAILVSFVLLGLFPLLAKRLVEFLKSRKVYARFKRPPQFDCNLLVIGAGAAGLTASYVAAALKAKVLLVESGAMGGDCLNTGCVPSKTLIRTSRFLKQMSTPKRFGVAEVSARVDFAEVMDRVQAAIDRVAPHDSVARYTTLGVEVVKGRARITSPWTVEVIEPTGRVRTISCRAMVIATGARPSVPKITGIESVPLFTSENIWSLRERPRRMVVLGGGPIGCELSQAFARLGSEVTMVLRGERLLPKEDSDASSLVTRSLADDGVRIMTETACLRCERSADQQWLVVQNRAGGEESLPFEVLLSATGRQARTEGFGLTELGITVTEKGVIETDPFLRTIYPNIYACGDVAGPYQFTHTAAHQAKFAAINALLVGFRRFRVDYRVIPRVTFCSPEVARVGLSELEAAAGGVAVEVTRFALAELDRAITDDAPHGFVKILTQPGRDRILGATIVGENAGELLAEFTFAMQHGLGMNKILNTIHPYPTWSEAAKYTAGQWKKAHAPEKLLAWLQRYHQWRRGGDTAL